MKKITIGPHGGAVAKKLKENPLKLTFESFLQYGNYFRIQIIPGLSWYVISDPAAVEHILVKQHHNYRKPSAFVNSLKLITGSGMLTANQDSIASGRRQFIPLFQMRSMERLNDQMANYFQEALAQALPSESNEVEIFDFMLRVNYKVYTRLLLGEDLSIDSPRGLKLQQLYNYVHFRMYNPLYFPVWVNTSRNLAFKRGKVELDDFLWQLVVTRLKSLNGERDILSSYLKTFANEGEVHQSRRIILDQIYTLLFAGHDTVGTAFGWLTYLLSQHTEIQDKLKNDFQKGSDDYFKMVLSESLRLYPTAWSSPRVAISKDMVNGHIIPKGMLVILPQYIIHRHPELWENPNNFHPERFSPDINLKHRYSYFPFGIGARMCLGNHLTSLMGKELFNQLSKYKIESAVAPESIEVLSTSTLRAKNGIIINFTKGQG